MLKEERQYIILEEIKTHNKVYSSILSKKLDVSEDTIRRDLNELANHGHIKKVHGGAMANPNIPAEIKHYNITDKLERQVIAQKAANLISDGQVLILEGETTSVMMTDYIPKDVAIIIFTNSLLIASKLFHQKGVETIFLGGQLSKRSKVTVGMDVENALRDVHADLCFIEASSIHETLGITEGDRDKALTKKAMLKSSSKTVALCLSHSIGRMEPFKIEEANNIDIIISELEADHTSLESIRRKGVQIY